MAVTVTASHFVCGSAENDASLKAAIDANPSLGMYESGAAVFRSRSLSIPSGTSLTLNDYTNLVFDDAAGYRIDLAGKLDFKFGGGITYNGDVQHTFLNGELHGENITYTLNGNVANGRSDFFSPNTSSASTLKNLRLVYGKGAAGYNYYTHLEPLAGRIDGLTLINNLQVASTIYVQFGNGTYSGVALPKLVSNFGVTAALSVYLARSGGNSRLPKINITGQSLTIVGDTLGAAELIDESWPDIGNGQYGTIAPGLQNVNNTTVARKLTFIPGSLFDAADNIFVRITDSRATPGVYLDGAIASASGTEIQWASYSRNPNLQTDFGAINLVARRWDMVEQVRTYNITKTANGSVFKWASDFGQTPFTYSALNVVDTYATSKRTALVGIAFDAVAKTVTFSQAMTWDDAHDFAKFYLTQNRDVANFVAPSGDQWVLTGGWGVVVNSGVTLNAGAKLKTLETTATVTNNGTINAIYTSSAGTSAQLALTGLAAGSAIYVANGAGQVDYVASSGASYTLNIAAGATGTWTYKVARYGMQTQTSTFTPSVGGVFGGAITLIPDTFVVDTLANTTAYTDLNTTQKIYDYLSLYGTTNAGIVLGSLATKGFGTLTVPAGLTLDPAAASLITVSSGVVTAKCTGLAEDVTIISTGAITQGAATLSNAVKIRASNLDSELVFVANSITLYPTAGDRDAGTNAGPNSSNGIIRFKFGAVQSGVTMSGSQYSRVNVGVILLSDFTLVAGANLLDLGTSAQLAALSADLKTKPTLAQIEATTVLAKEATLTALASTNQTEHDATQGLIAALPAPLNSTQTQAAAAAALTAYDAVVPADLAGLATTANVTAAQTAIVGEVNANEAKIDAVKADTAAIKAKTDALTTAPTVAEIRAEMETVGGKLDTTLKTAKKVGIQTL